MDIVIPLKKQSGYTELKYCLRSIEQFIPDHGNIFIVGYLPNTIHNVIHIPGFDAEDRKFKEKNICNKILLACKDPRVSDDFIYFNDDQYLLADFENKYYYVGLLADAKYHLHSWESHLKAITNTLNLFSTGFNFDNHAPIVYNKQIFIKTMKLVKWTKPWGYGIKSVYCNINKIEGEFCYDAKLDTIPEKNTLAELIAVNKKWFSTSNRAINDTVIEFLESLYPNPSYYEKNHSTSRDRRLGMADSKTD